MRKTFLAVISAVVSSLSVTASAADLPTRAYPTAAAVVPPPIYDWSGFYIGINGGGGTSSVDWNLAGVADHGSHTGTGGAFGAQFGYRWQRETWVVGVVTQVYW